MKKNFQQHHSNHWKKYIQVSNARESDPDAFKTFFEQFKLEAFFFKASDVTVVLSYFIEKDIVEVNVRDMMILRMR